LIGTVYAVRLLASAGWDATVFLQVGEGSEPAVAAYVEELLQHPVHLVPGLGHDARFFFVHAVDPWLAEPDTLDALLDRPRYRAGRMLYPVLVGGLGFLPPEAVLWMLPAVNVLAMGLGTLGTALLAHRHGLSPWFGLAFALNPGILAELVVSGSGVVALALALWGVLLAVDGRRWWSGWALAGAVLSRETMVIGLVGLTVWWTMRRRGSPLGIAVPSLLLAGAWRVWVTVRLSDGAGTVSESLSSPFRGFVEAFEAWESSGAWLDMAVAIVVVVLSLWLAVHAIRSGNPLAWAFAGFCLLLPLLTSPIWLEFWDITRAVAPATTAAALLLAARVAVRYPSAALTTDA
jgi:hypothetical protein